MKHKIFWEKNSRVKGVVPSGQIINKTSTDKFPCDAVTIRMANLNSKNPVATAYFYGKEAQGTSWGGTTYTCPETRLMVTFEKEKEGYSFNGGITSFSLQDIKEVLDSVRETINKI